jgi:hypothetical protein
MTGTNASDLERTTLLDFSVPSHPLVAFLWNLYKLKDAEKAESECLREHQYDFCTPSNLIIHHNSLASTDPCKDRHSELAAYVNFSRILN